MGENISACCHDVVLDLEKLRSSDDIVVTLTPLLLSCPVENHPEASIMQFNSHVPSLTLTSRCHVFPGRYISAVDEGTNNH